MIVFHRPGLTFAVGAGGPPLGMPLGGRAVHQAAVIQDHFDAALPRGLAHHRQRIPAQHRVLGAEPALEGGGAAMPLGVKDHVAGPAHLQRTPQILQRDARPIGPARNLRVVVHEQIEVGLVVPLVDRIGIVERRHVSRGGARRDCRPRPKRTRPRASRKATQWKSGSNRQRGRLSKRALTP